VKTFDPHHLASQTSGDTALQRELLMLFADQSTAILTALNDPDVAPSARADLAHKLTGSARAVGAVALAEAAAAAEAEWRAGIATPGTFARLPDAGEAALAAIRRHLGELP
jgi:HPt (histidine-containing phosphotransfer) domain-containing protein